MLIAYIITLVVMSFITSTAYGYDFAVAAGQWKHDHRPRIPEYILLTLASLGGAIGAWIVMTMQRHKASKEKKHFHFVIYFSLLLNLITLIALITVTVLGG